MPEPLNTFLFTLSITLNSHPHLSLISVFPTLPLVHMPLIVLKHIISRTSVFLFSCAPDDPIREPYAILDITTLSYNNLFTSLTVMFYFYSFLILPIPFSPPGLLEALPPPYPHQQSSSFPNI